MSLRILCLTTCIIAVSLSSRAAHFVDATVISGLQYEHGSSETMALDPGLQMAGGVAAGDYDNDGFVDLFVTRLNAPCKLFRNLGNGTFVDMAAAAGVDSFVFAPNGAQWGDIDNDGDLDLLVSSYPMFTPRPYYLFMNQGNGTFLEEGESRISIVHTAFSMGFGISFGDYDLDGWLDAIVCEWGPNQNNTKVLRNLGSGQPGFFEDVTEATGIAPLMMFGFAPAFVDLDGDRWQDIAISGDFGTSKLFWNNGDGTFRDGTILSGVARDQNGMGSTFGDYDGDGDLDWFVTAIHSSFAEIPGNSQVGTHGNRLYRNEGQRIFVDQTVTAGVQMGYWGWGTNFLDYNNDTDLDLVMTNGFNMGISEPPLGDWVNDPMRFWENNGKGVFTLRSDEVGVNDRGSGKGLITLDFDQDGDLDIFVVNSGPSGGKLLRNDGGNQDGNWLKVKVRGTTSNRDGLGARIKVFVSSKSLPMIREVGAASHYLGQSDRTQHFGLGLGKGAVSKVEVFWPMTGKTQTFKNVARNSTLTVVEE